MCKAENEDDSDDVVKREKGHEDVTKEMPKDLPEVSTKGQYPSDPFVMVNGKKVMAEAMEEDDEIQEPADRSHWAGGVESVIEHLGAIVTQPLDDTAVIAVINGGLSISEGEPVSNREFLTQWLADSKNILKGIEVQLDDQVLLARKANPEDIDEIEMDPWIAFYDMQDYVDLDYKMDMTVNSALMMLMQEEYYDNDRQKPPATTGKRNWEVVLAIMSGGWASRPPEVRVRFEKFEHGSAQAIITEHSFEVSTDSKDSDEIKSQFCQSNGMGEGDDGLEHNFIEVYKKPLFFASLVKETDYLDKDTVAEYVNLFLLNQKIETHLSEPGNMNILRGLIEPLEFS